jgi:putative ABC transport system substrate-binding protein
MMRWIAALLALVALSGVATAEPRRIGFLGDGPRAERHAIAVVPLKAGLRELGYIDGQTIVVEERWSEGKTDRLPELAAELVKARVEVIVTHGLMGTRAAQAVTKTIPIVFAVAPDAVGTGLVASLGRPGGNTTGLTDQITELAEKEIEVLKQALPQLRRVAFLWNETNPGARLTFNETRKAAEKVGLAIDVFGVKGADELEAAIERAAKARPQALIVIHDTLTVGHRARIAQAALKHGLPTICGSTPFVDAGGLFAYAPSLPGLFKRSAQFVDKILRGAKPADMPVEQPTTFQLRVNMKTAKALGLTIPPALLLRADDVIQ